MPQTRQLAAIMFTDIVGYTALMGEDEQKAFQLLRKNRQIQQPIIKQFNGTWIKELGDGILASFSTATEAVQCSIAIQHSCNNIPDLKLRIGIHLGDMVFEDNDVFGDGVNIASRLQALAPVGGIWVSESVHNNIANKKGIESSFVGEEKLKNVKEPVRIYEVKRPEIFEPPAAVSFDSNPVSTAFVKKKSGRRMFAFLSLGIIVIAAGYFIFNGFNKIGRGKSELNYARSVDKSIAVLPFENMSNDPQQDYFADGMMDEILNHLFKIGGLRIISRTSAMSYKGTKKPIKQIAQELGVAHLLEGSVQKEGQKIRIRIKLIDGKTDEQVWGKPYDREFKDVFAVQSDIAQNVAAELKIKLDPDVKSRIEYLPTQNTAAYNLYLQASAKFLKDSHRLELLNQVIALDSTFAPAYADLALFWLSEEVRRAT